MSAVEKLHLIDPEDQARADLYGFLGALLAKPADSKLLYQIQALRGDDTPIGQALHTFSLLLDFGNFGSQAFRFEMLLNKETFHFIVCRIFVILQSNFFLLKCECFVLVC